RQTNFQYGLNSRLTFSPACLRNMYRSRVYWSRVISRRLYKRQAQLETMRFNGRVQDTWFRTHLPTALLNNVFVGFVRGLIQETFAKVILLRPQVSKDGRQT